MWELMFSKVNHGSFVYIHAYTHICTCKQFPHMRMYSMYVAHTQHTHAAHISMQTQLTQSGIHRCIIWCTKQYTALLPSSLSHSHLLVLLSKCIGQVDGNKQLLCACDVGNGAIEEWESGGGKREGKSVVCSREGKERAHTGGEHVS